MKTRIPMTVLIIGLAAASPAWARSPETTGRAAAQDGTTTTVTGTLQQDDCGWTLITDSDVYRIMLGRFNRSSEIDLSDSQEASVHGFVMGGALAPITLTTGGQEYQLWNEDGRPVWARGGSDRRSATHNRMSPARSMPHRNTGRHTQRGPRNR